MFAKCLNQGWIEVIVGSMFSGKSEELIRRVRRADFAKQRMLVFKHAWDSRYCANDLSSHCGNSFDAIPVHSVDEMKSIISKNSDVELIAVDEVQFFDISIVDLIESLANRGKRVIVAGLDQDFKGEPFPVVRDLLARAEIIQKLNAICTVCGAPASKSQRMVNGSPAKATDPVVMTGASETYEARCRKCHVVG